MEIITYVRQRRSPDTATAWDPKESSTTGDIQIMSAGTGIRHAEFNKGDVPLKLYQVWLLPREPGGSPRDGTRSHFPRAIVPGASSSLASGFAGDEGRRLPIRADAVCWAQP